MSLGPNKLVGAELEAIVLACYFMADDFSAEFYGKCNSASLIIDYLHEYNADLTSNNGGGMKVLLVTEHYPFSTGESFLESEMQVFGDAPDLELTIAPLNASGVPRQIPKTARLDLRLSSKRLSVMDFFTTLTNKDLYRELLTALRSRMGRGNTIIISLEILKTAFRITRVLRMAEHLACDQYDLIYCYWCDVAAYAFAELRKHEGYDYKLVTRVHGFDLYEHRRRGSYQPFKRWYINEIDTVYAISQSAKEYLTEKFGAGNVSVSRLGVMPQDYNSRPPSIDGYRLISVSSCIALKRVDMIFKAILLTAEKFPNENYEWTHVGDGPLFEDLKKNVVTLSQECPNLVVNFSGHHSNDDVLEILNQNWDLFVNASVSEGVPVSIMEAMSFGIPVVAPDIGGISELVDKYTGVLVRDLDSAAMLREAIVLGLNFSRDVSVRHSCRDKIEKYYDAQSNFSDFLTELRRSIIR